MTERHMSLPPGEREWLVSVIEGVERRVGKRLEDVESRLAAVERTTQANVVNTQTMGQLTVDVEQLSAEVRKVLQDSIRKSRSDLEQSQQIADIEHRLSRQSTRRSAITSSSVATAITVLAQVAEHLIG